MAEVPVDFEVEIEGENGAADGLKKSEGINGVSRENRRLSHSGNSHCFGEEDF